MHKKLLKSLFLFLLLVTATSCDNSMNNSIVARNNFNNETAKNMLKSARHIGRLAELPSSNTDFKIATEGSVFTRSFYIAFNAPLEDIEKLILNSPGLKDIEPKIYSKEYMFIEYKSYEEEIDYNHDFFLRREGVPEWYTPEMKIKGRKYNIPYKKDHGIGGYFIVNDEEKTVYIYVSWS